MMHNILLLDDNKNNLLALELLLSEHFPSLELHQCLSPFQALDLLQKESIDLIISDIHMPHMDGFAFGKKVRENPKLKHIPLIFSSAVYCEDIHKITSYEVGAIDFIEKPINEPLFVAKISLYLELFSVQKELKKEHSIMQSILDTQSAIVLLTDGKKAYQTNQAFSRVFGYESLDEFKKEHDCICDLFIEKEGIPHLSKYHGELTWIEYLFENSQNVHEAYMYDKHGQERVFQVSLSGDCCGDSVVTLNDITLLKERELGLELQARHGAMEEVLHMMAHQWRQPLTGIGMTLSNILLKDSLGKLTPELLHSSLRSVQEMIASMSHTIDSFRDMFNQKYISTPMEIKALLEKPWELLAPSVGKSKIDFRIYIESSKFYLCENTGRLEECLLGIYKNSIEALEANNPANPFIHLDVIMDAKTCTISIEDNGGGVGQKDIKNVFEPYFSTKSKNRRGLGLFNAKRVIETCFNGKIKLENIDGGTKVLLMLPMELFNSKEGCGD